MISFKLNVSYCFEIPTNTVPKCKGFMKSLGFRLPLTITVLYFSI